MFNALQPFFLDLAQEKDGNLICKEYNWAKLSQYIELLVAKGWAPERKIELTSATLLNCMWKNYVKLNLFSQFWERSLSFHKDIWAELIQ